MSKIFLSGGQTIKQDGNVVSVVWDDNLFFENNVIYIKAHINDDGYLAIVKSITPLDNDNPNSANMFEFKALVALSDDSLGINDYVNPHSFESVRNATEEEENKVLQVLSSNGYMLHPETGDVQMKRERVEQGCEYHFFDQYFITRGIVDSGSEQHTNRFNNGNYFHDPEVCREAARRAMKAVEDYRVELFNAKSML